MAVPSLPQEPEFDSRRDTQRDLPPASRRDPLGAPPFGGGAAPYMGGGQPYTAAEAILSEETGEYHEESCDPPHEDPRPVPTLSLRQDDLLLLGLLLFLLHEQDEEGTDCRDALLLLAVLFVSGL